MFTWYLSRISQSRLAKTTEVWDLLLHPALGGLGGKLLRQQQLAALGLHAVVEEVPEIFR